MKDGFYWGALNRAFSLVSVASIPYREPYRHYFFTCFEVFIIICIIKIACQSGPVELAMISVCSLLVIASFAFSLMQGHRKLLKV